MAQQNMPKQNEIPKANAAVVPVEGPVWQTGAQAGAVGRYGVPEGARAAKGSSFDQGLITEQIVVPPCRVTIPAT